VVFADQQGVHVIWQLAPGRPPATPSTAGRSAETDSAPRIELTYRLDSGLARQLQACYGQLTQLGYKIADVESLRAVPEKPVAEKRARRAGPEAAAPGQEASNAPVQTERPIVPDKALAESARPAEKQAIGAKLVAKPLAKPLAKPGAEAIAEAMAKPGAETGRTEPDQRKLPAARPESSMLPGL
jgi:hypothetical protein